MHPRIHAENQPDAAALVMADSGETITFAELEVSANRAAHALRELGVGIADCFALVCDNRPEFFDLYWAAQRAGAIILPVSTRLKPDELAYIVNDSGAKLLLVSDAYPDKAAALAGRDDMPGLEAFATIGAVEGLSNWTQICAGQPETRLPTSTLARACSTHRERLDAPRESGVNSLPGRPSCQIPRLPCSAIFTV